MKNNMHYVQHGSCIYQCIYKILIRAVAGQRSSPESCFANKTKMFFRAKIKKGKSLDHITLPKVWHSSIKYKDIRQNQWTMKYRSQWPTFIFRSNTGSYWLIIPKYGVHISNSLQVIRQNHWTMKYRSQWPTFIFRSNFGSYRLIIPNNGVHTSNSLQGIRQNNWTMKYRSQWPTFIFRSNIGSH